MKRERMRGLLGKLDTLSPLSILQRGYSITRKLPALKILRDAEEIRRGDQVEVRLHRGALLCEVEATTLYDPSASIDLGKP
jgi:exodeoxyribonuclease VII large subunit